jgi:phosphatidylglycerophosphate synthase
MSLPAAPQLSWTMASAQRHPRRLLRSEMLLILFTAGRLALMPIIIVSFLTDPAVSTIAIIIFIVADIYDGVLARRFDADGPSRRALDSIVDRVVIDGCLAGAYFVGALPGLLLVALLARDAYCAVLCARMVRERNVAIKADWLYRALNLSVAAWALSAPFLSPNWRTTLAAFVLLASVIVAFDLTRSVRRVREAPLRVKDLVIDASNLRRGIAC